MKYFDHIEDFHLGKLNEEQEELFRSEMDRNPDLMRAVSDFETGLKISEGLLEIDIRNTLEGFENARVFKAQFWKWLQVVAILIPFLLWIGYQSLNTEGNQHPNQKWVALNYNPPVDMESTKSENVAHLTPFQKAKYSAQLNDFNQSIIELLELQKSVVNKDSLDQIKLWLQFNYIQLERWDEVDTTFLKQN